MQEYGLLIDFVTGRIKLRDGDACLRRLSGLEQACVAPVRAWIAVEFVQTSGNTTRIMDGTVFSETTEKLCGPGIRSNGGPNCGLSEIRSAYWTAWFQRQMG